VNAQTGIKEGFGFKFWENGNKEQGFLVNDQWSGIMM